jgi:hypothetical protein
MKDDSQGLEDDEMPTGVDRILRALADQDADDSLPAPGDERLRAWREGRLPPEEAREMEETLGRSAAGRRRLLELSNIADIAGIDRSLPLRRVRKAVLDQADRPVRRRIAPRYVAAMAIAATIVLALAGILSRHRALPEGLAYDVSARGLAEVRSVEEAPGEVQAYPDTTLRIFVRPQGDSPAGLSFALFRLEGGGGTLRRVRQPDEVRLESERGSAALSGIASRVLATRVPGAYPLFVVVTREMLPSSIELKPGQAPEAALKASGRLVYPVKVILLRAEEGSR